MKSANQIFGELMTGKEYDKVVFKQFYKAMGEDVKREKERIGGNFAIAHVVLSREIRDLLR